MPSTLHQCFKFYKEGVKTVIGDIKPFTEAESHFADAKFYTDDDTPSEVLLMKNSDFKDTTLKREDSIQLVAPGTLMNEEKKLEMNSPLRGKMSISDTTMPSQIFKYVPLSRRKNGESPFI